MALLWFPAGSKTCRTEDGTQYAFVHKRASAAKPTFMFIHGFPSSSYDWRHQVHSLSAKGFGVLAPDLLGYGSTDSPDDFRAYNFKAMSAHLNEILDEESIKQVIGVGHDCLIVSTEHLAMAGDPVFSLTFTHGTLIVSSDSSSCLLALVGLPTKLSDQDTINALTEKAFGTPCFGYWKLFDREDAATLLDQHSQSIDSLLYPTTPDIWLTDMAPLGAAESWIRSNKITQRPEWLDAEEASTHNKILSQKGYRGPLNWYKAGMRGAGAEVYEGWPDERKRIKIPTLFLGAELDYVTRADIQKDGVVKWAESSTIEVFKCGHWIQLELPEKVNDTLLEFAKKFDSGSNA